MYIYIFFNISQSLTDPQRGGAGRGRGHRGYSAGPSLSYGDRGRRSRGGEGGWGGSHEMHSSQGASHGFRGYGQNGDGSKYRNEPRSEDSSNRGNPMQLVYWHSLLTQLKS